MDMVLSGEVELASQAGEGREEGREEGRMGHIQERLGKEVKEQCIYSV